MTMKNRPMELIKRTKLPISHHPDIRAPRLLVYFHRLCEIYTGEHTLSRVNCNLETKLCAW